MGDRPYGGGAVTFWPPPVRLVAGGRSYENDQNQCKVDTRMAGGWGEEQWDSDQKLNEQRSSVWLNIQYSFNDRISVLIILLQGSVDALHYTVTATVDFVLGMYFNLTSYLCHSPVTPQAELVYWAAITDPWKLVCFRYFEIQCIAKNAQQLQKLAQKGRET